MMEQALPCKGHSHSILVAGIDHVVVADRTARLGDIRHAAFAGPLNIVPKGEEGVGAQGNAGLGGQPFFLFLCCKRFRLYSKQCLPHAVGQYVLVFV